MGRLVTSRRLSSALSRTDPDLRAARAGGGHDVRDYREQGGIALVEYGRDEFGVSIEPEREHRM
jgi:hypothetical protein